MNIKIWSKSFLSIYHLIPKLIEAIDRLVVVRSLNSSNFGDFSKNCTYNQINSILSLSQKKINLINLKLLTDETILEMSNINKKVLYLRFIDNVNCDKVAEILDLKRRTFFRRVKESLNEFEIIFCKKLLNNKELFETTAKDNFLDDIFCKIDDYNKIVEKSENQSKQNYFSANICSLILNRIKKTV